LRFAFRQALDNRGSISFSLFEKHSFMKQDGQSNDYVVSRNDIFFFIQYSLRLSIASQSRCKKHRYQYIIMTENK
jgi:hypothetical protein